VDAVINTASTSEAGYPAAVGECMTNVVTKGKCVTWRCRMVVALGDATDNGEVGPELLKLAQEWLNRYPQLVGVSTNSERTQMPSLVVKPAVLLGELTYWSSLLDLSSRCG